MKTTSSQQCDQRRSLHTIDPSDSQSLHASEDSEFFFRDLFLIIQVRVTISAIYLITKIQYSQVEGTLFRLPLEKICTESAYFQRIVATSQRSRGISKEDPIHLSGDVKAADFNLRFSEW